MKITTYVLPARVSSPLRIAIAADLHGRPYQNALDLLADMKPDLTVCPGDMMELTDRYSVSDSCNRRGFAFLKGAAAIAPVYYSLGNHELGMTAENRTALRDCGVTLLENQSAVLKNGWAIGGLSSGQLSSGPSEDALAFLARFSALDGGKLLLCHHPEYYPKHIRETDVDVTVSGHAHGGQWRFFGRGIYAPGQGIFPKYTKGVYENRLCVSRGMANTVVFPRFFNPREVVLLVLEPKSSCQTTRKG